MKNSNSYGYRALTSTEYEEIDDIDDDGDDDEEENLDQNYTQNKSFEDSKRKKRKLESFVSNYDFTPPRKEMWTEEESFVLLEVWGERYIELGRRSLRAEDWSEVTEKVVEMSSIERTEVECRHQMDVLKNKYKKERAKVESGHGSKWVFFKKMDVLLNMKTRGHCGLGCGVDSGEYVFMNPRVYLERSNVLDEMRDSPGQSDEENDEEEEEEAEDLGVDEGNLESTQLLAESIQKFGQIYEKIEVSKRKQMMELEKMRQDFQRELEMQKKQIVEQAEAEIAKIREIGDDEHDTTDSSLENLED